MINHEAIYRSHPTVVSVIELDGVLTLKDSADADVPFDQAAYDAEVLVVEQEILDMEAARLSAIQKIATAAGLNVDEQKSFFGSI